MMNKIIPIHLLTLVLISCGGGSGSGSNENSTRLVSSEDAKINLISGVYKTVRTGPPEDKAFLYIADDGNVTVYDDQMDAKDNGSNCYKFATSSAQINSTLHNGITTFDSSTEKYTITKGSNSLSFTYTDADGMKDFSLNGSINTGAAINLNTGGVNINLGAPNNKKDSSIDISTLESSICP